MTLFAKKIDWRSSEGHQRLLINFLSPNSADNMPKWIVWDDLLGESVNAAVDRLKSDGALLVIDDPKIRILHSRGAKDLKDLCVQNGLKSSGTKIQMAERLAGADPTGKRLGYGGELLQCSSEAEQIANARRAAWELTQLDDQDLRGTFDRKEFDAAKERLKRQFQGRGYSSPSDDDVKWAMLNDAVMQHAKDGNLGLCRNAYMTQARFLYRRNKYQGALRLYLIVCAYDLNGPENRGGMLPELLKEFPLFDLRSAFLAPGVVDSVNELATNLKLAPDKLQKIYFDTTLDMGFPLTTEKTWSVLSLALEGKIDLTKQPECDQQLRALLST